MSMLTVASPALKALFERVGKPEIVNRPALLQSGGKGAIIVCNHVGWADSLWLGYSVYPRQLRHLSKQTLFDSRFAKWILTESGAIPIDRAVPSLGTIKSAVNMLRQGEVILIFPSGTRDQNNIVFKRGAATIALHAQVPIVPAFYQGPTDMNTSHLMNRPRIRVTFGSPAFTKGMPINKPTAFNLTQHLEAEITKLAVDANPNALTA